MSSTSASSLLLQGREFTVPVPWGVIAGREWGDPAGHPWIAIHGWLDNCGSFDHLAPLFPRGHRILAVDYPGHGKSSPYPKGHSYHFAEALVHIRRISQHFKLSKFGLLGHSMGGAMSVLFAATHPEYVSAVITCDILKPRARKTAEVVKQTRRAVDEALAIEGKIASGKEPVYSMEMARERLRQGMFFHGENPITEDAMDSLLKRGVKPAPNASKSDEYVFSRDIRHRTTGLYGWNDEHLTEFATSVKCPMILIKASQLPLYAKPEEDKAFIEIYTAANPLFEWSEADGNHHVHLNNAPEVMAKLKPFLEKHEAALMEVINQEKN